MIDVHDAPDVSQRFQRYAYEIGAVPVHVPGDPVRSTPDVAVPVTVGSDVLDGAVAATTAVGREVATVVPRLFVAVMRNASVDPMSTGPTL